jgi:hypothetical protein
MKMMFEIVGREEELASADAFIGRAQGGPAIVDRLVCLRSARARLLEASVVRLEA